VQGGERVERAGEIVRLQTKKPKGEKSLRTSFPRDFRARKKVKRAWPCIGTGGNSVATVRLARRGKSKK